MEMTERGFQSTDGMGSSLVSQRQFTQVHVPVCEGKGVIIVNTIPTSLFTREGFRKIRIKAPFFFLITLRAETAEQYK